MTDIRERRAPVDQRAMRGALASESGSWKRSEVRKNIKKKSKTTLGGGKLRGSSGPGESRNSSRKTSSKRKISSSKTRRQSETRSAGIAVGRRAVSSRLGDSGKGRDHY